MLAVAYPHAAGMFRGGGVGVDRVIDPLFLQFNGGTIEPRSIVFARQGNGDLLCGGRTVLVGDGHFKGLDFGFVLAEPLDRVGLGFIRPLPGGGIEGQRAVFRLERGRRAAFGGVGTLGSRAGGVMFLAVGARGLAAFDVEGLVFPGVAVVVADRECAADGQLAALRDVPVLALDFEGGDVVGAVDGHGDGLRCPSIVLVAHVDGKGFVNGVAFGELIKGSVGLAVDLKADVFVFALHGVGVGTVGFDRQAAVLPVCDHGRGLVARGGGVGRVELHGRIEGSVGLIARSRAEIQDMPCIGVIAGGGSGVGGMIRKWGVFLAGIVGGGVGVFTAHAVLDHMEAVAAEQPIEVVVGKIQRGDVVGAVDGDGDGLGFALSGLGVGDVDGEGLGYGLAEGEVVDGVAVRFAFQGILVGAVRMEGQGAVG